MDRVKTGNTFRAIRIEMRLRQRDVAERAEVSQATISAIERGHLGGLTIGTVESVAGALEADLSVALRWRGASLARLLDRRHASMQNVVVSDLRAAGWEVLVEESFNHFGDRGSVDILAWHAGRRGLLIVEIKTEIVDLQDLLRALDIKERVVPGIVRRSRGWQADRIATIVVLPATNVHRGAVAAHAAMLDAALPARTKEVRGWVASPSGDLRGIWFLPCISGASGMEQYRAARRVRAAAGGSSRSKSGANVLVDAPNRAITVDSGSPSTARRADQGPATDKRPRPTP